LLLLSAENICKAISGADRDMHDEFMLTNTKQFL
jgi:hypothetical protein